MKRVAALDIGTNTTRLLVADVPKRGTFSPLVRKRAVTRLGEGAYKDMTIQDYAIKRTFHAIKEFVSIAKCHNVEFIRAVGTGILREAKNSSELLKMVKMSLGVDIDIVTGVEEARLSLLGAIAMLDPRPEEFLLFDLGGGSTEFIWVKGEEIKERKSILLGAVSFRDIYLLHDPPLEIELERAREAVHVKMKEIEPLISEVYRINELIGTSGSVSTLGSSILGLSRYEPGMLNNKRIWRKQVDNFIDKIKYMDINERKYIRGIAEGHEDIIIAGSLIIKEIMSMLDHDSFRICEGGLLEGIVLDKRRS